MITAIVLDKASQNFLFQTFRDKIPPNWDVKCHHMTINMSAAALGPAADFLGQRVEMVAVAFAQDSNVMAIKVETPVQSNNLVKHITIAVNTPAGAKPKQSNLLKNWQPIMRLQLSGVVEEMK